LQIGWDALKVQPANAAEEVVPLAGIEPALLAELDFESSASTSSATGALRDRWLVRERPDYSRRKWWVNTKVCPYSGCAFHSVFCDRPPRQADVGGLTTGISARGRFHADQNARPAHGGR
jgi:hypothetical protein